MQTDHATLGGRYEILEELGPKGVSVVYRGCDRVAGREVVIKRVAPDLEDRGKYTEKDLVEDAIALASLRNPNFLTVYDFGKDEQGPFVVTEPLRGVILEGALQKNELSVEQFIRFVKQTLDSLVAAHEAGLTGIHLDPWNIMLLRQAGGRYRVKILGLGRVATSALPILDTEFAVDDSKPQGNEWAEYLSLGRLYYQALTQRRPFGDADSVLVKGSRALEELVSCRGARPDVPGELCDWVMWLIREADTEPGLAAEQVRDRFHAICADLKPSSTRERDGEAEAEEANEARKAGPDSLAKDADSGKSASAGPSVARVAGQSDPGAPEEAIAGEPVDSKGPEKARDRTGKEKSTRHGEAHAISGSVFPARGEVPMTGSALFRSVEESGVFLPAPLDAIIPEDSTDDASAGDEAGEPAAKRKQDPDRADTSVGFLRAPQVKVPESEVTETGVPTARAVRVGRSQNWPAAVQPVSKPRPEADPLREDAAETEPLSTHSFLSRWPAIAVAMLLSAVAIILAGSALRANLGGKTADPPAVGAGVDGESRGIAIVEPAGMPGAGSRDPVAAAAGLAVSTRSTLSEALAKARASEEEGDDLAAFHDYFAAMRWYPTAAEAREALMRYVESLSERPPDVIGFLERGLVESAEEFQIGPAMRILGEQAMRRERWDEAFEWLSKATVQEDVPGTRLLGNLLAEGKGVAVDLAAAAECFEWAAARGDARATLLAGECFVMGKGVEKDASRGVALLEAAADSGELGALDLLGVCYAQGLGVEKDYVKALSNFRSAAEGGYPGSLTHLGVLHIQGLGVKQDAVAAVAYFRDGAEAKNADCMYYYAKCLEQGLGVEMSRVEAVKWYRRAVAAGSADAQAWFDSQEKRISN